jgi:hypothetical protein
MTLTTLPESLIPQLYIYVSYVYSKHFAVNIFVNKRIILLIYYQI